MHPFPVFSISHSSQTTLTNHSCHNKGTDAKYDFNLLYLSHLRIMRATHVERQFARLEQLVKSLTANRTSGPAFISWYGFNLSVELSMTFFHTIHGQIRG